MPMIGQMRKHASIRRFLYVVLFLAGALLGA